ncbi:hypothetical protein [Bacillus sp. AFS031507]|uniref:hypothetical protein n=1 Tax=Bacillus sp. AFS031507 TaxID=2033496 RepID=UPI0015D4EE73|nr:hypothetical protein [Bacillus sp. AFS031507]
MNQSIPRMGRITAILSGILLVLAHSLNLLAGEHESIFGTFLIFAAHLLLVFAFFGLYSLQGDRNGLLGLFAMILGNIGNIIVTAIVFVEIAQASGEKVGQVFTTTFTKPIYTFGPLLFVVGMILLGVSMIRGKVFPKITGYLLLIGTIVFAAASVSGDSQKIVEVIGALFTGAGFIVSGLKSNKLKRLSESEEGKNVIL